MREIGEVIGERYRLEGKAGSGAMGVVYRATDLQTGGAVAVKLLLATTDETADERFLRESAVLASLRAPEIVLHLAHGRAREGAPYLVTEWLEGETVEQRIARARLGHLETVEIGIKVATALDVAHRQQVVHRDIKPGNVFLLGGSTERAKVLDFGIARIISEGSKLTGTNNYVGTPKWLSPEQARSGEVDGRSDLFSLGSFLYACLVGCSPFEHEQMTDVVIAIARGRYTRVEAAAPGVPPRLAKLIGALLAHDPDHRPADARAVIAELLAIRHELLPVALPMPAPAAAPPSPPAAPPPGPPAPMPAAPPVFQPVAAPAPFVVPAPLVASPSVLAAPAPAKKSNAPIILLLLVPALLIIAAAIAIFFYAQPPKGSAASSSAKTSGEATPSSKKSAPADDIDLGDRSNVDAMVALGVLEKFLLKKHPGVEVVELTAMGMPGGKIDLTQADNMIKVVNAQGATVQISAHGTDVVDTNAARPFGKSPFPSCSFKQLYADAVAQGFPADQPFRFLVTKNPAGVFVMLQGAKGASKALIDPATCKVTSAG